MVQFKDKKKKVKKKKNRQLKTTLNHRHNETINTLNKKISSIPQLKKKQHDLQNKLKKISKTSNLELTEDQLEDKLILIENLKEIDNEISILESGIKKEEYLLNTSHMLFHYFDDDNTYTQTNTISPKKNNKTKSVLDFFSEINLNLKKKNLLIKR